MKKEKKAKEKKTPWKIVETVFDWVLGVFIGLVALVEIVSFATKGSNYGVPSFFGYQVSTVLTDSMAYDETGKKIYPVGDGLIINKPDFSSLQEGDDIVFYGYYHEAIYSGERTAVTVHRIIGQGEKDGSKYFITRGTNTYEHPGIASQVQIVYEKETANTDFTNYKGSSTSDVLVGTTTYTATACGAYMGKVLSSSEALGNFYTSMSKPYVILLLIVIPCALIAVSSIVDIIKIKKTPEAELQGKKEAVQEVDPNDPLKGMSEEEKKKLKAQMLEKMMNDSKGDKK